MNDLATVLLVCTVVVAVVDWLAVHRDRRAVELVAKPLTLVLLIGVALALDPVDGAARVAFVTALVFSLLGDVLLVQKDRRRFFPLGLAAFLIAHLAYIPGLVLLGVHPWWLLGGVVVVGATVATLGRRIVSGVRAAEPRLATPVTAYVGVISAMVVAAIATARPLAIVGAALFYASDALIAWTNFIVDKSWGRVAVMVTYHLGQILLVLALV